MTTGKGNLMRLSLLYRRQEHLRQLHAQRLRSGRRSRRRSNKLQVLYYLPLEMQATQLGRRRVRPALVPRQRLALVPLQEPLDRLHLFLAGRLLNLFLLRRYRHRSGSHRGPELGDPRDSIMTNNVLKRVAHNLPRLLPRWLTPLGRLASPVPQETNQRKRLTKPGEAVVKERPVHIRQVLVRRQITLPLAASLPAPHPYPSLMAAPSA